MTPEPYLDGTTTPQELLVYARIEYLTQTPVEVPTGRVVVHNNVRPTRHLSLRGFRAWLAESSDERLVVCDCTWAPELVEHYRLDHWTP